MHADAAQVPVPIVAVRGRYKRARGDVDGRSAEAKRVQRLMAQFVAELGGLSAVSPTRMLKIRRASELTVTAEQMRAAALRGEQVDPLALVRLENLAGRAVAALNLDKHSGPPVLTLQQYLSQKAEPEEVTTAQPQSPEESAA
jgi:hypothetical protein